MRERISSMNSYQPIKLGGNANIDERDFCKLFQMSFFFDKRMGGVYICKNIILQVNQSQKDIQIRYVTK